jgi:hypothetical protein
MYGPLEGRLEILVSFKPRRRCRKQAFFPTGYERIAEKEVYCTPFSLRFVPCFNPAPARQQPPPPPRVSAAVLAAHIFSQRGPHSQEASQPSHHIPFARAIFPQSAPYSVAGTDSRHDKRALSCYYNIQSGLAKSLVGDY